ncbi:hypothetical protein QGN32_10945 [Mycolicibacterium sp. ND9-15]|nr:hypothetical protein [Mycolicibacterium sp. ND9-15]WSE58320.1 hypothetical protein QGN32_10945 [Mycolicibacterium sp. ND9-15]
MMGGLRDAALADAHVDLWKGLIKDTTGPGRGPAGLTVPSLER